MQNFISAPHRGESPSAPTTAPNAALLIDFDNVTMGIRSDLTRQLKELLNSDIIRGKVAVQRAYADWRRYAQYIVPLSEASVDLIFAPAYGSSKKNATDIRLAIDALELVFTRPEIGVYILLSGDSDFSSLVLKLKEYGKYVIGVGLRESASDLLVQNCDEYFSYSSLTGLTKASEEDMVTGIDPFDLVERSVTRMAEENDVMRSDRLKQVMLDLDPNFDEGEIGYSKFNKFLTEAASRSKLALRKLGNGQYEVQPITAGTAPAEPKPRRESSRGRKRAEPRSDRSSRGGGRSERAARKPKPEPQPPARRAEDLDHGYELLKRAIGELIDGPGDAARDSDIKRKILALEPGWDESEIGFTKFSRFLRQAHDAEVIDLQRTGEGYYEARLPTGVVSSGPKREHRGAPSETTRATKAADAPSRPEERREKREQQAEAGAQATEPADRAAPAMPQRIEEKAAAESEAAEPVESEAAEPAESKAPEPEVSEAEPATEPSGAEPEKEEAAPTTGSAGRPPSRPSYGRRGRRGRASDGPPPLLPGQAVGSTSSTDGGASTEEDDAGAEKPDAGGAGATDSPAEPGSQPEHVTASTPSSGADTEEAVVEAPVTPSVSPPVPDTAPAPEPTETPREAIGTPEFDPEEVGLPVDREAVIRYLSNSYQGVGQKTAEALIETFGEDRVFNGLNSAPDRVREVLGSGRRTEILLEAWQRDYRRRTTAGAGDKQPTG